MYGFSTLVEYRTFNLMGISVTVFRLYKMHFAVAAIITQVPDDNLSIVLNPTMISAHLRCYGYKRSLCSTQNDLQKLAESHGLCQ